MKHIVEIENLSKKFSLADEELEVLTNINLRVQAGEFISIMGPSGSGKSSLLYLIGGLDAPTSGSIKIKGMNIAILSDKELSALRRKTMGFVFQFYNLIPDLTVEENILLPLLIDGKKVKDYRDPLDEILHIVEMDHKRNQTPRQLSGGQQQRVAIARALMNEPDIILADEPIGNLDSKTGTEIMKLFRRINQTKGKTIIQVTHASEAATYGSKTIMLKDGAITDIG